MCKMPMEPQAVAVCQKAVQQEDPTKPSVAIVKVAEKGTFEFFLFLFSIIATMTRVASCLALYSFFSMLRAAMGFAPPPTQHQPRTVPLLEASKDDDDQQYETDIPLVFIHGMKGSHLALNKPGLDTINNPQSKKRAWLSLRGLLNFPPRADDYKDRDLSMPLTYSSKCGTIQDRGDLTVDGLVEHIIEMGPQDQKLELLPFYGHVAKHVRHLQESGKRPTATYVYDWRRSLPEISDGFYKFCEETFPGRPVQVLAHSMGGLITFDQMRKHPEKFAPGAVLVGVPFGTGIQYFQDLHRGYYTEIGRNRQFTPPSQFTMSSHWSFFPMSQEEAGDTFVDVTNYPDRVDFRPDESAIGKPGTTMAPTVSGDNIQFDYYNVDEWEKNEVGIFDPAYKCKIDKETLAAYKNHMDVQLKLAKAWRQKALCQGPSPMPDLVVCQTNTIPTLNQILRRKRSGTEEGECCQWEYDYISGRSVPGDGRIDFDKSFPPKGFAYKEVALNSMHAKQMCWEENKGSLGVVMEEVTMQLEEHLVNKDSSIPALADEPMVAIANQIDSVFT